MKAAPLALALFLIPAVAQAQSFGIGGRMAMIRGSVQADTSAERFLGGQIRARVSPRTAVELALDVRSETNKALTLRRREMPIQASLLLFPVRAPLAPYLLGGGGWYSTRLETLVDRKPLASETTREFGWHGGFGAELKLGTHAAAHADYRYTFLRFGDDVPVPEAPRPEESGVSRFLPSYRGSMWTAGLTLYF